jgi:hypothetical protein
VTAAHQQAALESTNSGLAEGQIMNARAVEKIKPHVNEPTDTTDRILPPAISFPEAGSLITS